MGDSRFQPAAGRSPTLTKSQSHKNRRCIHLPTDLTREARALAPLEPPR